MLKSMGSGLKPRNLSYKNLPFFGRVPTCTPKVCRTMAFYGFWAIILPTFGGLGNCLGFRVSRSVAGRILGQYIQLYLFL